MIDIRETAKPGPTFDAESMRAILAGRKTQTRRVLKDTRLEAANPPVVVVPSGRPGLHPFRVRKGGVMDWEEFGFRCLVTVLMLAVTAPVLAMYCRATLWILTH